MCSVICQRFWKRNFQTHQPDGTLWRTGFFFPRNSPVKSRTSAPVVSVRIKKTLLSSRTQLCWGAHAKRPYMRARRTGAATFQESPKPGANPKRETRCDTENTPGLQSNPQASTTPKLSIANESPSKDSRVSSKPRMSVLTAFAPQQTSVCPQPKPIKSSLSVESRSRQRSFRQSTNWDRYWYGGKRNPSAVHRPMVSSSHLAKPTGTGGGALLGIDFMNVAKTVPSLSPGHDHSGRIHCSVSTCPPEQLTSK